MAPAGAQVDPEHVATDCFADELRGPVETVEVVRVPLEVEGGAVVEGEPRVLRRARYDARCHVVEREYVGSLRYAYWDDPEGRGRRFVHKRVPDATSVVVTVPAGRPPVPAAERERGTLRATAYDPEARVLRVTLTRSGRLVQDVRYTLDAEGRVVHELMTDSDGMRSHEVTTAFGPDGERVEDYEYPVTAGRSVATAGRRRYRVVEADAHGNWTRRTLDRWVDGAWEPREVGVRRIAYRDRP